MEYIILAIIALVLVYVVASIALAIAAIAYFVIVKEKQQNVKQKGDIGEAAVKSVLGPSVEGKQYVINNFMFRVGNKTCQIDHIVINKNGVYVIETKNYSGAIYGTADDKYWIQKLGSKTNKIYSPVKQNAAHVYNLSCVLSKHIYLTSLIVFVQNNTENIRSEIVIPLSILKQRLALPSKIKPYTEQEMREIYEELWAVRDMDITNDEHVARIYETREKIRRGICPVCGRTLVTRQGKYGEFLGCSGYPECKFKRK